MQLNYNNAMAKVKAMADEVDAMRENLDQMDQQLNDTYKRIEQLHDDKIVCEQRLVNAGKLIDLLAEEGERWTSEIAQMEIDSTFYNGNVFIAAASLSYLGPFSGQYRKELETIWIS